MKKPFVIIAICLSLIIPSSLTMAGLYGTSVYGTGVYGYDSTYKTTIATSDGTHADETIDSAGYDRALLVSGSTNAIDSYDVSPGMVYIEGDDNTLDHMIIN